MVQTKTDIVAALVDRVGLKQIEAAASLRVVLDFIQESLEDGDTVQLTGFGTFSVKEKPERKGHNPSTGEEITIPARTVVRFKPGKLLKDAV